MLVRRDPRNLMKQALPENVRVQWGIRVPLRDGTYLSATLYLPTNRKEPAPAIFAMTPYVADHLHERSVQFAACGYPCLAVDVRGRGNSQGTFHTLNETRDAYAQDGYDVVEWISEQPYCNGKVAMWGGSYLGYCQWATVRERPPHLATVVPVASPFQGVDVPLRNNVFPAYAVQWLMTVSGRASQSRIFADNSFWTQKFKQFFEAGLPFRQLDAFVGNPSALFQEDLSHPQRDAHWDRYSPSAEQYSQLTIPILTITGAYDGDQLGALEHYRRHMRNTSNEGRSRHYLIVGPWDHGGTGVPKAEFCGLKMGPASLVDMLELHRQWYAWVMQGGPKPEFLQKNVAYYVAIADKWRYADTLESITACSAPFYLHSDGNPVDIFKSGSLEAEPSTNGEPDHYVYDPRDVGLAELESTVDCMSLTDQRMVHAMTGKHLVYHSEPLSEDTEVSGFFKLSVWLSIDQPDTDLRATVYEVTLDGSVVRLTQDWMRARYRESLREAKLVTTEAPLRYEFKNCTFVSRQIKAGHRLRLVLGPINSIYWQKNYNAGGVVAEESMVDARPVTVRLFHDEAHPSALYVPFAAPEAPVI